MLNRIQRVVRFGVSCATYPIRLTLMPFEDSIQRWGERETKKVLNDYGLKYHDILLETPEVVSAMDRLSAEEKLAMQRRLTRAFDCSLKQKPIPADLQDKNTMLQDDDFYLGAHLADIEQDKNEREKLNWY
jgi:hypothetical protein